MMKKARSVFCVANVHDLEMEERFLFIIKNVDGVKVDKFPLHIKEMEWCFNNRNKYKFNILVDYLLEKSHI